MVDFNQERRQQDAIEKFRLIKIAVLRYVELRSLVGQIALDDLGVRDVTWESLSTRSLDDVRGILNTLDHVLTSAPADLVARDHRDQMDRFSRTHWSEPLMHHDVRDMTERSG